MAFLETFLPPGDRHAALLLYGMIFSLCFNGYDAGIMTVILADKQFIAYYGIDAGKSGLVATIPWATTGTYHSFFHIDISNPGHPGLAQLFLGGTLANIVGRLWALRISITIMVIGV